VNTSILSSATQAGITSSSWVVKACSSIEKLVSEKHITADAHTAKFIALSQEAMHLVTD
jgi:hypothetical protein